MKKILFTLLVFPVLLQAAVVGNRNYSDFSQATADAIYVNVDGDTMTGPLSATTLTASGADLTSLTPANISAGSLLNTVITSSNAVDSIYTNAIKDLAVTDGKINTVSSSKVLAGNLNSVVSLTASSMTVSGNASLSGSTTFYGTVNLPTREKIIYANEIANSSKTLIGAGAATTQTSLNGLCLQNSSVTITTVGGTRVEVHFTGAGYQTNLTEGIYTTYKIDSVVASEFVIIHEGVALGGMPMNFDYLTDILSAGAHTFCVAWRITAGTGSFYSSPQFWVKEVR